MWYYFGSTIVFYSLGNVQTLTGSGKCQLFDMEKCLDSTSMSLFSLLYQGCHVVLELVHARVGMSPAVRIGNGIKLAQPFLAARCMEESRAWRNEQAN